jgi:hypothetical protein
MSCSKRHSGSTRSIGRQAIRAGWQISCASTAGAMTGLRTRGREKGSPGSLEYLFMSPMSPIPRTHLTHHLPRIKPHLRPMRLMRPIIDIHGKTLSKKKKDEKRKRVVESLRNQRSLRSLRSQNLQRQQRQRFIMRPITIPLVPCAVCGKANRWEDAGVSRCRFCYPPPASSTDGKPRMPKQPSRRVK